MRLNDEFFNREQSEPFISKIDQARMPNYANKDECLISEKKPYDIVNDIEEGKSYKLRRLEILPGGKTSLQKHFHRNEFIYILIGAAIVTIENQSSNLVVNEFVNIPKLTAHRIENQGVINLVILEIQNGEYLGDDDIVKIEDDYGQIEDQIIR